jgi:hypothetical protein
MNGLLNATGLLIDCGRASKQTRGPAGAFWENGVPPNNKLW